jgi:tetraacyldisaccharide 4'-kinase
LKKLFAILLSPISLLYGVVVGVYQGLYLAGVLKSTRFNIPVIAVGNLSVGGTGKSPHVEYLIRLLRDYLHVGVISRGYMRKTRGFIELNVQSTAEDVGDEPLQIKRKFPDIPVAVHENRSFGIPLLLRQHPEIQTILMDDAFQHLQVRPGLNLLLTEYDQLYVNDYLLPSGRLREWRYGANRADFIIVTKCPDHLLQSDRDLVRSKLRTTAGQKVFFSKIRYENPYSVFQSSENFLLNDSLEVILVSAIAQSSYLNRYLESKVASVRSFRYEDHHFFKDPEVEELIREYDSISHSNKMLLTTEKDAVRLSRYRNRFETAGITLYAMPISIEFFGDDFDQSIRDFLLNFKV